MSKHPIGPWSETVGVPLHSRVMDSVVHYGSDGKPTGSSPTPSMVSQYQSVRTGYNSGHILPSQRVPRPASLVSTNWHLEKGWAAMAYGISGSAKGAFIACSYGGWSILNTGITSTVDANAAFDKAFSSLQKSQGATLQSLVVVGELAENITTVRRLLYLFLGRYNKEIGLYLSRLGPNRSINRGMAKSRKAEILKTASDEWLEVHFALMPLISDLNSALKGLAEQSNGGKVRETYSSAAWTDQDQQVVPVTSSNISGFQCDIRVTKRIYGTGKCGYTLSREYVSERVEFNENFGLNLRNFVPSVWELIPYSWLVDYVTNIGDVLMGLAFHRGIADKGWYVKILRKEYETLCLPKKYNDVAYRIDPIETIEGRYIRNTITFNRGPFSIDTYFPELRFEVPMLSQALNVIALALSRSL